MVIKKSKKEIIRAIRDSQVGVEKYIELMDIFRSRNISKDLDFRRRFNHFYRMMKRSQEFYNDYFYYLEKNKNSNIRFFDVISHFEKKFNRMEPSFSSKLIATINPNFAIWDKFVLRNLGLTAPPYNCFNRKNLICDIYKEINKKINAIVKSPDGKTWLRLFDEIFPSTNITDIKKIDFILWKLR